MKNFMFNLNFNFNNYKWNTITEMLVKLFRKRTDLYTSNLAPTCFCKELLQLNLNST